jgi:threonine dehydrogenase-like Zn-dependent dehydrogenase
MIITGGGIIGLLTGAFSKLLGAGHVIISDPIKERRDMAIKLGIDTAINPKEENLEQVAQKLLGNYGCDIAVEAVGNLELLKELYKIVKPKGTIQLAGVNNNGNNFPFDSFDFHYKELTLTGAFGMGNYFKESLSMLNCLDFGDFNAKSFPLDKIVEGFLNSIEAKNIKTFIKPNNKKEES